MDLEKERDQRLGQKALDYLDEVPILKSSLRMQYEAETRVFCAQHGGLEDIRQKLGFSRRKMCQLLLVDPSAWTRWMKDESKVPPHIYRSLEWFLALNQKVFTQPDLAAMMNARFGLHSGAGMKADSAEALRLQGEVSSLRAELIRQRRTSACLMAAIAVLAILMSFSLIK